MSQEKYTEIVTLGESIALMRGISAGPLVHASTFGLGIGGAETNFAFVRDLNIAQGMRQGAGGSRTGCTGLPTLGCQLPVVHLPVLPSDLGE
ncbi:hypothetical protein ACT3UD_03220 [Glutamicibacter sp. 287]|uniref:hypothetical protein n=1 Tax=unclassified Glutamicibacter TaxID=2627139 RepID=UPI0040342F54